jgi:hypothetical protein
MTAAQKISHPPLSVSTSERSRPTALGFTLRFRRENVAFAIWLSGHFGYQHRGVTEAAPDLEPTDCVEHFDVNVLKDACGNSRWLRNTCHLVYAIPAAVLSRNPRR